MLLYAGVGFTIGLPPTPTLLIILVNVSIASLSEELMFRGVLLQGLRSRLSIWPAILISSAIFGAIHVLNFFGTGDFDLAVLQAAGATVLGVMLVAIRLRSGSLVPAVIVHALWNFCVAIAALSVVPYQTGAGGPVIGVWEVVFAAAFLLPVAVYSFYLLRGIGRLQHARP